MSKSTCVQPKNCWFRKGTDETNRLGGDHMQDFMLYLSSYGLMVVILILAQVLAAARQVGLSALAGNREDLVLTGLAGRMERAANNSLLALALVAPAVLITHLSDAADNLADQLMLTFLLSRIAYVALYALGIVWFRTVAWIIAFVCTALLYVDLIL
jgi:uncharacterized MAPEG superfamily protein